ncbi:MAG: DHHA1 domain-containing protein, partial [Salinisphaera sp.]|nr:DHHA1 domain-containing protein [Salinisphaera sp.]
PLVYDAINDSNRIASVDGVAAAKAAGMRVLVTDHHLPGQQLPDADAIVNPNQPGCGFASRCLAGVGVLFYVLLALRARLRAAGAFAGRDEPSLADELDLVAIGTVADVVPLDRNNRILVEQGLRRIRAGRARPGVYALARAAGRDPARLNAADIGFGLAPRLNAAGRLQDMALGVACLLAADDNAARQAALRLEELNTERRELQAQMQADAMAAVAVVEKELAGELPAGLCVYRPSWHEGIVGLVAGRVREHYHRPTVAFAPSGDSGMLKGSARSLPGVHIRDVLERLATADPGLMTRFGGHASAAGLTLHADRLEDFTRAFGEELNSWVSAESLAGLIETDGALGGDELSLDNARLLRLSGPWGAGFPEPVFDGLFTVDEQRVVGSGHLKLRVRTIEGERLVEAIAFGRDRPIANDQPQRLVYRIDSNIYRGMESVQLVVSNVEPP